jgi:hypothetical protein
MKVSATNEKKKKKGGTTHHERTRNAANDNNILLVTFPRAHSESRESVPPPRHVAAQVTENRKLHHFALLFE